MKEQLEVTDLKGNKIGIMNVTNFWDYIYFVYTYTLPDHINKRLKWLHVIPKVKNTQRLMTNLLIHLMTLWERRSILSLRLSIAEDCPTNTGFVIQKLVFMLNNTWDSMHCFRKFNANTKFTLMKKTQKQIKFHSQPIQISNTRKYLSSSQQQDK